MKKQATYFVGIDLHKSVAQVCVLDGSGGVLHEHRVRFETLASGQAFVRSLAQGKKGAVSSWKPWA